MMDPLQTQSAIEQTATMGLALKLCYRMAEACDYELVIAHSEDVTLSGPIVGYRGEDDYEVWATFDIRLVDAGFEAQLADAMARLHARVAGSLMWDGESPDSHEVDAFGVGISESELLAHDELATLRALLVRALERIQAEDAASANGDESELARELRAAVEEDAP